MFLGYLVTVLVSVSLIDCKRVKSGVFDNVTVCLQDLDETSTEDVIFIDYDDRLSKYVNNRPSEIISITNQFISKLETNSLSNLPKVRNLTLTNCGVREIHRGTFKNLPNLKLLNLSHNVIEEVSNGVFNNLSMLDLYLDNNKISRIAYKAFSNLHLRHLFLNNNKIASWNKEWFADISVVVLNMGFNLIAELPADSFHLMSEPIDANVSVIFSNNQLKRIGNDVFVRFESFDGIFLDGNSMRGLETGAFNGVKYINTLNLNNNNLSEVDADLLRTTQVDVLMLEDNKLQCLSTDIFRMEELDIDGNPITCLCVQTWLQWRDRHSNPSIYHITNLEEECI